MKVLKKENIMKNKYKFKPTHFFFDVHGSVLNSKNPKAVSRNVAAVKKVHATPRPNEIPLLQKKDFKTDVKECKVKKSKIKSRVQGGWRCVERRNYRANIYNYFQPAISPAQEWLDSVVAELEKQDRIKMRVLLDKQNERTDYDLDAQKEHWLYEVVDVVSSRYELLRLADEFIKEQERANKAFLEKCYGGKIR